MDPHGNHGDSYYLPCLHCQPSSYVRMVQHLIERCLLLHMSRDACIGALARRANIPPTVTLIVWGELMKENRAFFRCYFDQQQVASRRSLYQTHGTMRAPSWRRKHWWRRRQQRRFRF